VRVERVRIRQQLVLMLGRLLRGMAVHRQMSVLLIRVRQGMDIRVLAMVRVRRVQRRMVNQQAARQFVQRVLQVRRLSLIVQDVMIVRQVRIWDLRIRRRVVQRVM